MVKIWAFYISPHDNDIVPNMAMSEKGSTLYALTNNKKFAKQFMRERNMDKFRLKKMEISEEDWDNMSKIEGDHILDLRYLTTRLYKGDDLPLTQFDILVLCTMYEYQESDSDFAQLYETSEDFWTSCPNPRIFNKKMQKALSVLQYKAWFDIVNISIDAPIEYDAPNTTVDEFGIFVSLFYRTFK